MTYGTGSYRYACVEGWGRHAGESFGGVIPGIAVDAEDLLYLLRRSPPAVLVYDQSGKRLAVWGEDILSSPHGACVDGDGDIWITDVADHTVRKFSPDGMLQTVYGTPGTPGSADSPFNKPTDVATAPDGRLFVTDGYGQHRVHCLSPEGALLRSWGRRGSGPGEFALPHGAAIDTAGNVLVADRENSRIQAFDATGQYRYELSSRQWPGILFPNKVVVDRQGIIYMAEAQHRLSIWSQSEEPEKPVLGAPAAPWKILARWGDLGSAPGQFLDCPHGLCVDSRGSIYVTEVPRTSDRVLKFERVA
jgi:sugar lactone lactonase YvrE